LKSVISEKDVVQTVGSGENEFEEDPQPEKKHKSD